jgi:hypothetical protein
MLYQQVHRPFWRRHPALAGTGALVVAWWLWLGPPEAVAITAIAALLLMVNRRRRSHVIRDAGLRARADYEHGLSLSGDPRGMFGRYPPVQAGWYHDPQNRYQLRYFDGAMWTQHIARQSGGYTCGQ